MARSLLLATGVVIGLHRGLLEPSDVYAATDQLAISSLTAAELLVGAELAPPQLVRRLREIVEATLETVTVLDHDLSVTRVHALLMAHTTRTGQPLGAFDLAIAATAVAHRRTLATTDAKAKFADLPGLEVEVVGGRG
jgi:tRNA(fMet)-specific endonuclease VapC